MLTQVLPAPSVDVRPVCAQCQWFVPDRTVNSEIFGVQHRRSYCRLMASEDLDSRREGSDNVCRQFDAIAPF